MATLVMRSSWCIGIWGTVLLADGTQSAEPCCVCVCVCVTYVAGDRWLLNGAGGRVRVTGESQEEVCMVAVQPGREVTGWKALPERGKGSNLEFLALCCCRENREEGQEWEPEAEL